MILQLKCDRCGKIETAEELGRILDEGSELCAACLKSSIIKDLKREIADKREWLESTHLKKLRELEEKLAEFERS